MEARFAIATRHSRIVRILRIAVPAAVLLALATIVGVSIFNPFRMLMPKLPLDVNNLVVSGTKVTMEAPHLSGYTPDRRPYEVWAKTATQDVTSPDHVELNTLHGKVLMEDQSTVTLEALTGLMDTKQQLLDLHKNIYLHTSTGYEAWLSQAFVDMGKGTVDVIVTEGFTGNIALKTAEGTAKQIGQYMRDAMRQSWLSRLGYWLARDAFRALRAKMDELLTIAGEQVMGETK